MAPAVAFALASLVATFLILNPQDATGEVGLVFAPWMSEGEVYFAVIDAGGRISGPGRWSNTVVAYVSDPAFHARIRQEGAWFAMAATAICATPQPSG